MVKFSVFFAGLCLWATSGTVIAGKVPWHLESVMVPTPPAPSSINAWGIKPGDNKVVVAVLDSGVISEHPALRGRLLPGYDMQQAPNNTRGSRSENATPESPNQSCKGQPVSNAYRTHGTEVTSLIAGNGEDGVWGVNPNAYILPIRIMGPCPASRDDIIDAMAWAAGLFVEGVPINPNPAHIINLSFSGGDFSCDRRTQELIDKIVAKGIFVVAAAGNNFGKQLQEPANCHGVISVGALNAQNELEVYSALDQRTTIYAPGGGRNLPARAPWAVNKLRVATEQLDMLGRPRLNGADRGIGTSYAAPVVSGLVALLLSHQPDTKPETFKANIKQFAEELQFKGLQSNSGDVLRLFISDMKIITDIETQRTR